MNKFELMSMEQLTKIAKDQQLSYTSRLMAKTELDRREGRLFRWFKKNTSRQLGGNYFVGL